MPSSVSSHITLTHKFLKRIFATKYLVAVTCCEVDSRECKLHSWVLFGLSPSTQLAFLLMHSNLQPPQMGDTQYQVTLSVRRSCLLCLGYRRG